VGRADEFGSMEICNGGHPARFHVGRHGGAAIEAATLPIECIVAWKWSMLTVRYAVQKIGETARFIFRLIVRKLTSTSNA
jgi:hypothetical protein